MPIAETSGIKYDSNKPDFSLISPIALAFLAQVLTFGAKKYAAHNWRKGIEVSRLVAASSRHLEAIRGGIFYDTETGLPHAAHLMCEAMFMCEQLVSPIHNVTDDTYDLHPEQKHLLAALLAGDVSEVSKCITAIHLNQTEN